MINDYLNDQLWPTASALGLEWSKSPGRPGKGLGYETFTLKHTDPGVEVSSEHRISIRVSFRCKHAALGSTVQNRDNSVQYVCVIHATNSGNPSGTRGEKRKLSAFQVDNCEDDTEPGMESELGLA